LPPDADDTGASIDGNESPGDAIEAASQARLFLHVRIAAEHRTLHCKTSAIGHDGSAAPR
jgi:hypothetical protein